jgi:hypothetical protein
MAQPFAEASGVKMLIVLLKPVMQVAQHTN